MDAQTTATQQQPMTAADFAARIHERAVSVLPRDLAAAMRARGWVKSCTKRGATLWVIDCRRPRLLRNPYPVRGAQTREVALTKHWVYLTKQLHSDSQVRTALSALVDRLLAGHELCLVCACKADEPCHCDSLRAVLSRWAAARRGKATK